MNFRIWLSLCACIFITACEPKESPPEKKSENLTGSKLVTQESSDTSQPDFKTEISSPLDSDESFDLEKQQEAYQLTLFEVLDVSESPYDNGPALAVSFSVPLDLTKDVQQHLQVYDKDKQPVQGAWVVNNQRTRAFFQYIEPSKSYQVVVSPQIQSINRQELTKETKKNIRVRALKDSVTFVSKGKILPSKLTRGIAVESVNIDEVDINFHRVIDEQVPRIITQRMDGYSYYVREIPNYSELVYTARYQLDSKKNKTRTTVLPVHKIPELQKPGLYIAVMSPAGVYPYQYQVVSFYMSNLGLKVTNFENSNKGLVNIHTFTLDDGKALAKVNVSLVDKKGKLLAKATTDNSGNYTFQNIDSNSVVLAQFENDFAVLSLSSPALDLSEQVSITRIQQEQELFLYGPRDLYRPGEKVKVNAILRDFDGQKVPSVPLQASLTRPDGRLASSFTWHPHVEGFYQKEFNISNTEPTGKWTLSVTHPSKANFQYSFSVEEFLPERMKLELTSKQAKFAVPNEDITIFVRDCKFYQQAG